MPLLKKHREQAIPRPDLMSYQPIDHRNQVLSYYVDKWYCLIVANFIVSFVLPVFITVRIYSISALALLISGVKLHHTSYSNTINRSSRWNSIDQGIPQHPLQHACPMCLDRSLTFTSKRLSPFFRLTGKTSSFFL